MPVRFDAEDPLKNIVFISIPENFRRSIGTVTVDSAVQMPVEVPPGSEWDIENLSWEMIIAGMLKILAYRPDHRDAAYYRDFILEVKPDIVSELSATGVVKAQNKEFDVAEDIFKALSNLLPEDVGSLLNLALVYEGHAEAYEQLQNDRLREKCLEKAFDAYKRALKLDPDFPELNFNMGLFFLKQRSYEKSLEHLRRFIQIGTDAERVERAKSIINELSSQGLMDNLFKEAFDFIRLGKEREGIAKIRLFLETHSEVWNAWFLLGWAHRRLGEYQDGKAAFLRALDLGGTEADTHNELAICLMELGELEESRRQLLTALKKEPENTKVLSNLGIVSMKADNNADAAAYFQAVLAIEPEDPIATRYLKFLTQT